MKPFAVYSLYDVTITKAKGSHVWDDKGVEYLDMYGGHAVISIGHTNPRYVKKLTEQLSSIGFYSNSVRIPQQTELCEKLTKLTGKTDYQLFLCNSGAEANENAMKLASFHTGKKKIIAFKGSFHGRTSLAVAATNNPAIVAPVNETPNIIFLPLNDVDALEKCFAENSDIAAVIVEGIQGVAGIVESSKEFLRAIRSQCDKHGAVYIADSVQCGCGRSGSYYSHDWAGVDADIYSMAKGIGNGFPMGAILISPKFVPKYGMLGTTFGGNHLACAAAIAVADEMIDNNLIENARKIGDYLITELKKIKEIKEVRGRGLMIGIDLGYDSAETRKKLLYDEKVFVGSAGNKNVVRLLPALNVTKQHADQFLTAFKKIVCKN
ncbi:MAG: aminotransferase class III-fold pyridoxal phosphate-dependent enzyme [Rikenellaceae bacterium]